MRKLLPIPVAHQAVGCGARTGHSGQGRSPETGENYPQGSRRQSAAPGERRPEDLSTHADVPLYRTAIARAGGHDHKERQIVSHAALNWYLRPTKIFISPAYFKSSGNPAPGILTRRHGY